jgi:hypothetical protein
MDGWIDGLLRAAMVCGVSGPVSGLAEVGLCVNVVCRLVCFCGVSVGVSRGVGVSDSYARTW